MLLWSCLVPLAQAHVPHDVFEALAAPVALDASRPWWGVLDVPGGAMLVRSGDAGRTWDIQAADPIADDLTMAAMVEDTDRTRVIVASSDAIWYTDNDGERWSRTAVDDHDIVGLVSYDGLVYVGTGDGIFTWSPGGLTSVEDTVDINQIASSDDGVVAVDKGGGVWLYTADGSGFRSLGRPTGGAQTGLAVTLASGVGALVGNELGELRVWDDGGWAPCQHLPLVDAEPGVVRLGAHGDLWLAANGSRAPFTSTDGCASWAADEALVVVYAENGGAESVWQSYTTLRAGDDRRLVAGWGGLTLSEDDGATWTQPALVPVAFVRGLEVSPDFKTTGQAWIGAYAAGIIKADNFGTTFSAPNHGLLDRNVQSISVDPSNADQLYAVVGHVYAASTDGGENWLNIDSVGSAASVFAYASPKEVWVTGTTVAGGVLRSSDGLTGWEQPAGLADAVGASTPDAIARLTTPDGRMTCVSAVDPAVVVCRLGDDGAWETRFSRGSVKISSLVSWPPGAANAWVVADDDGIWRSEDQGATWMSVHETPVDRIKFIRQAGDGTQLGISLSGHVLRSRDGGASWSTTSVQIPGGPRAAVMRPNFTDFDQMFVGSPDGVYIVDDASTSPRLRRFGGYEGLDSRIGFMQCRNCPGILSILELAKDYDGAWGDNVVWLGPDEVVGAYLRGQRLALRGVVPKGAQITVVVRDASTLEVLAENVIADVGDAIITLAEWDGLDAAWVDVEVTVDAGHVGIDFVESWSAVERVDGDTGSDTGSTDGGGADGGSTDGGSTDGASSDGASSDGGSSDGGSTDAATIDGGSDTDSGKDRPCGCAAGPGSVSGLAGLLVLVATRRRRRDDHGQVGSPGLRR